MTSHRSPRRRNVSQKSGYKVAGAGTGSTCKIIKSSLLESSNGEICITVIISAVNVPKLFGQTVGVIGGGAYVFAEQYCKISYEISWETEDGKENKRTPEFANIEANKWLRIGEVIELEIESETIVTSL